MTERASFLAQIAVAPLTSTIRCIFADWLDERGEAEEATRQRKFVDAFHVMVQYADYYGNLAKRYDDNDVGYFEAIMARVEDYAMTMQRFMYVQFGDSQPSFMSDAERNEFIDSLEILSGTKFDEDTKENLCFSCSC